MPPSQRRSDRHHPLGAALVALVPLVYVYMPRPPIFAARFVVFPVFGAILSVVVLWFASRQQPLDGRVTSLLVVLLVVGVTTDVSLLVNASEIRIAAILEVIRPFLFGMCLLYGYYVARAYGEGAIRDGLLAAARLILVGQAIIAVVQILGIGSVGFLYTEEKVSQLGTLLRATGSMGNPNQFAWVVTQAAVLIYAFDRPRSRPWYLIGALLVLGSGSRSMLLVFPFAMVVTSLLLAEGDRRRYARAVGIGVVTLIALLACVLWFSHVFPYLAQLARIGSLTSIHSFAERVTRWQDRFDLFTEKGSVLVWLFGLGSTEATRLLENGYLYVFFRLGVVGLLIHWTMVLFSVWILQKERRFTVAVVGIQYFISTLPVEFVREALGGWYYPLLFFFYVGLTVGVSRFSAVGQLPSTREIKGDRWSRAGQGVLAR